MYAKDRRLRRRSKWGRMAGKSRILAALVLAAFGLTACQIKMSPLKTDFAFSPESAEALVAIHAHKHIRRTDVVLRRVDLENRQFVRGQVRVTLQNSFVARALSAPGEDPKGEKFFVRTVPPGDYALIAKIANYNEGTKQVIRTLCFAKGTRVFRIEAGRMNLIYVAGDSTHGIIPMEAFVDGDGKRRRNLGVTAADLAKATRLLKNYPNIDGKVVAAKKLAVFEFEGGSSWLGLGPNCPRSKSFQLVKRQARAN